jgi:hypothetical protein
MRLVLHAGRCVGRLMHEHRIALRHFIHLRDGLADFPNAAGLLPAGGGDLLHDAGSVQLKMHKKFNPRNILILPDTRR